MKRLAVTKNSERGVSIIELTCALFVVSMGAMGAMDMYLRSLDGLRTVTEYDLALAAVGNELETLRMLPYEALEPGREQAFRSQTPGIEKLHKADARVAIREISPGPAGLKQVTVRVRWVGEHGRTIEKWLVTLIAQTEDDSHDQ